MQNIVIKVGVGIIVVKDKKVLVGRRKGSHCAGLYSFPGGHLEFGESVIDCARRELKEECGADFKVYINCVNAGDRIWFTTEDYLPEYDKHYITLFIGGDWNSGKEVNNE